MQLFNDYSFESKRAILRVDFNVPIDKESLEIQDDKRIQAALPTIKFILNGGGSVVLLSHFGRPKNGPDPRASLRIVLNRLTALLDRPVHFAETLEEANNAVQGLQSGEVLLVENVRFFPGETEGSIELAQNFARLGDCYINDAFGSAHRAHASTTQLASFFPKDKMMGLLMQEETRNAQHILSNPKRPFTAILGGAKVSDKIMIIENLLTIASDIVIGGGMAYTFSKALGGAIGNSLVEDERLASVKQILDKAKTLEVKIHLPEDTVAAVGFSADAKNEVFPTIAIPDTWMGLDIGPKAREQFTEVILQSNTILWNGPMGVFEWDAFSQGTKHIAHAVAEATKLGAFSLIGGGDSAAAVSKFNLSDQVSYVSTGGGALLELFEGKELPGIKALR